MRLRCLVAFLAVAALYNTASAQVTWPQTRAEKTNYAETSTYDDVIQFIKGLQAAGGKFSLEYIGSSANGKQIPLVLISNPPVASIQEAHRAGKPVVYIQANIHGGEVEGKESALMLMRDLCQKPDSPIAKNLVLLIAPIYNIDGNEAWGTNKANRPSQNGPAKIGDRPNGKGLDLNRDCMKIESPEMRAILEHVYNKWNPDLMMDLHTTNGTRHAYQLTYSPSLNPNTESGILKYARDEMLPKIRKKLDAEGWKLQDYGNAEGRGAERAWRTFEDYPRYVTNYVGLRNRIAILSEAASFLPFKKRVASTSKFVDAILQETVQEKKRILKLTRDADSRVIAEGRSAEPVQLGIRFEMESRGSEKVPLEKTAPGAVVDHMTEPVSYEDIELPIFDRFKTVKTVSLPSAYILPESESDVVQLLRRHGIMVEKLTADWHGPMERFNIDRLTMSQGAFQGHRLTRLEGRFESVPLDIKRGDYVVRTAQPLGRLIFMLLEPESLDGLVAWGLLKTPIAANTPCPILKVSDKFQAKTQRVLEK